MSSAELSTGSTALAVDPNDLSAVMERVIIAGDLSSLTPAQRNEYYMRVCQSVGLNSLTVPFAYIRLNGKLVLYALRSCADQLRNIHGISIEIVDRKLTDGFLSVHVRATNKDGRKDEDYGVVPVGGTLAGEAGANLMMKAVTKAKRRVTLSICGLGMLDETEVVTVPGAEIVDVEGQVITTVQQPPKKRKSSAAGKRDGDDETFKAIMLKLENPADATECGETWKDNAEWLSTAPSRWYTMLLEAYVMSMRGFGVEVDIDAHSQEMLQAAA
jgi:hypothetical protein